MTGNLVVGARIQGGGETLKDEWRAVGMGLWGRYEGKLEGGLLYWGPRRFWKWVSVSIGALFSGTWGDAPFLGPLTEG